MAYELGIRTFSSAVFLLLTAKVPSGNHCSQERKFPGTFVPRSESSVPGIVSSLLTRVRDAGTAVKVNRKNIVK